MSKSNFLLGKDLDIELDHKIFQINLLKIILTLISVVAYTLLLFTIEKENVNPFQYLGLLFCPVILFGVALSFLRDVLKIKLIVIIGISLGIYVVLNVVIFITGCHINCPFSIVILVLISLVIESLLLWAFSLIYNSSLFYREIKRINLENFEPYYKLSEAKELYDREVLEYNAISQNIINSSKKLGMKKPRLKERSEFFISDMPDIARDNLRIFIFHGDSDIDYFRNKTNNYIKYADKTILDLKRKSNSVDSGKEMSVEVNKILNLASDPRFSDENKNRLKGFAEKRFRDLQKINKIIKKR